MIVLSQPIVTPDWQIPGSSWAVILPLAIVAAGHILFPVRYPGSAPRPDADIAQIVLNPWLMIFSY
jgi:hypothetical protein